jgi:hypothetical protein
VTVHCGKDNCDRSWPRDPVIEVECPACHAGVGTRCKRPSGHRAWRGNFHAVRDIAADKAGKYGTCPTGRCGLAVAQRPSQYDLF